MVAITAHFDGKNFIPEEPVDLPRDQRVLLHVSSIEDNLADPNPSTQRGTPIAELMKLAGTLDAQSAAEMMRAIEEGCEQVDPNDW
ncbi:MAG TPA: hypothetical protein VIL86_13265 [Tepidisphaeraceae bacterium]